MAKSGEPPAPDELKRSRVVVLGGGFGGLTFCQAFSAAGAEITMVDRQNHHLFQPLLYQVATAGLSAPEIAQPIRSILSQRKEVTVLMDDVGEIDLATRTVTLAASTLSYDYLVLALGGATSYFGHPEWEALAPSLKSLEDALGIRSRVLSAFEKAEAERDPTVRQRLMTIVVVGGGPTGVELAGAFAELTRTVLRADFRRIDPRQARVILVEAGPRLLAHLSEQSSAKAKQQLERLGVEVRVDSPVQSMSADGVELAGEKIAAANVIWAAGVAAVPLTRRLGVDLDRAGRIKVLPDLSVPGHPEVFAIGDLALVLDETGRPVPGISPAAMQMARHAARIIEADLGGNGGTPRPTFRYWDKGSMATIGRSAAVAEFRRLKLSGWVAWVAWLGVHLIFLIGFRNKLAVLLQWAYAYCSYKRGARIITGHTDRIKQ
jgi:NADH:ubiquinone reductase (H+-translocating)